MCKLVRYIFVWLVFKTISVQETLLPPCANEHQCQKKVSSNSLSRLILWLPIDTLSMTKRINSLKNTKALLFWLVQVTITKAYCKCLSEVGESQTIQFGLSFNFHVVFKICNQINFWHFGTMNLTTSRKKTERVFSCCFQWKRKLWTKCIYYRGKILLQVR